MIPYFFFFNDTATTEIYTLSLHDALPISHRDHYLQAEAPAGEGRGAGAEADSGDHERCALAGGSHRDPRDRKSTRLNSSHSQISYAVFCLKEERVIIK